MARILVIDDEPMLREDIADALRVGGHETLEAPDGRQGLEMILRESPDLVLSDINMPVMDGRELLETLRAKHPEHQTIPFVFLSAFADRHEVIAGKRLGADDYLTKPVDHELMLETVNARLREAERFDDQRRAELDALVQAVLAALPHELRTPLNGVIGFAELLRSEAELGQASPQAVEYVDLILESGHRLHDLIEKVLDLVGIVTGRIVPRSELVALPSLLGEAVGRLQGQAEKAGVQLATQVRDDLPPIHCDRQLLTRALSELIGNAVKFTNAGGSVIVSAFAAGDGGFKIQVVDTGCGIEAKWLSQLGIPFAKPAAGRTARRDDGAGLGLSLVRGFVALLGGELLLASEVRVGTTAEIRVGKQAA